MPREPRTQRVSQEQVRSYLAKAEEFLTVARDSLASEHPLAATSLAIHAGISAADAMCGARTGQRSVGTDHREAITLLERTDREGRDAAGHLARLIPLKNRAEYEPRDIPKATASRAVHQAERVVQMARQVVS